MDGIGKIHSTPETRTEPRSTSGWENAVFGDDGFSFSDLLDVVNPLQHIPIVGTIYRELSDDQIAVGPRLVGSHIFGGWLGVGGATLDVAMEHLTGRDVGEHVMEMIRPDAAADSTATQSETPDSAIDRPIIERMRQPPAPKAVDETQHPEDIRESLLTEARALQATPRAGLWEEIERVLEQRSGALVQNMAAAGGPRHIDPTNHVQT